MVHDLTEAKAEQLIEVQPTTVDAVSATTNDGLRTMLDKVETKGIREALARHKGNKKRTAESLGISRSYLYRKLSEMNEP